MQLNKHSNFVYCLLAILTLLMSSCAKDKSENTAPVNAQRQPLSCETINQIDSNELDNRQDEIKSIAFAQLQRLLTPGRISGFTEDHKACFINILKLNDREISLVAYVEESPNFPSKQRTFLIDTSPKTTVYNLICPQEGPRVDIQVLNETDFSGGKSIALKSYLSISHKNWNEIKSIYLYDESKNVDRPINHLKCLF